MVFSDFNYGCLPQALVERIVSTCQRSGTMMVADSQSSSQVGDVSRFRGMRLLTPTEREARLARTRFQHRPGGPGRVAAQAGAGARRLLSRSAPKACWSRPRAAGPTISSPTGCPALNSSQPKDVSGAGDSMLISASMALAVGADVWQSAYLGSIAAACQVTRVGNTPLSAAELFTELAAVKAFLLAAGLGTRLNRSPIAFRNVSCRCAAAPARLLARPAPRRIGSSRFWSTRSISRSRWTLLSPPPSIVIASKCCPSRACSAQAGRCCVTARCSEPAVPGRSCRQSHALRRRRIHARARTASARRRNDHAHVRNRPAVHLRHSRARCARRGDGLPRESSQSSGQAGQRSGLHHAAQRGILGSLGKERSI